MLFLITTAIDIDEELTVPALAAHPAALPGATRQAPAWTGPSGNTAGYWGIYQQMMAAPGRPHAGQLMDAYYRANIPAYGCARDGCGAGGWTFAAATPLPVGRIAGLMGETAEGLYGFGGSLLRGCGCFVAGTLVETDHGLKPIEKIKVGDRVRSRDEASGVTALKRVTALIRPHDRRIYAVRVKQVGSNLIETFDVTDDHPWMSKNGHWLTTLQLKAGSLLQTEHGGGTSVVSIKDTGHTADTYNLEVDGTHTFFVGKESVWVHNACDPKLAQELAKQAAQGSSEARRIMQGLIKDPRFPENTWGKFEYLHRGLNGENITVHFWRNLLNGIETGFKVK